MYSCGTFWTPSHCGERVSSAFNDENARVHEKKDDRPLSFRNAIALWLICKVSVPEREIIREGSAVCVFLSEKGEGEVCRMEQVARREWFSGARSFGSVEGIAENRVTDGGEVYANLVCAAGFRCGFDESGIVESFEYSVSGFGGANDAFHAASGESGALAIAAG